MADAARKLEESDEPDDEGEDGITRQEAVVELCDCVIDLVAELYGVSGKEMRERGRSRVEVARSRQIAMYVAHTVLDMSMREVGIGFGKERTTVLHAVHLVEDQRDDPAIDAMLGRTERIVKACMRGRKIWSLR